MEGSAVRFLRFACSGGAVKCRKRKVSDLTQIVWVSATTTIKDASQWMEWREGKNG
jgi:hypothetical protein